MVYAQNRSSIERLAFDSILLYFAIFSTHVNKKIQMSGILLVFMWEYVGFYSKHIQCSIYSHSVRIWENTLTKRSTLMTVLRSGRF